MGFRVATADDIEKIASLHAESWRRNYRGIYADAYLDGPVSDERLAVWTERLHAPKPEDHTVLAEEAGALIGFVHTILGHDPTWGALLDNLHVVHERKRGGLGRQLMAISAEVVVDRTPGSGLYLWVLEDNRPAQSFHDALGGSCVGYETHAAPGGGAAVVLRYAWPDPSVLT